MGGWILKSQETFGMEKQDKSDRVDLSLACIGRKKLPNSHTTQQRK
jgi:hypothetical protein